MKAVHSARWRARWALAAFLVTIVLTRGITTVLHLRGAGTQGGLIIGGVHIHHMVFGLVILMVLTFDWMLHEGEHLKRANQAWPPVLFGIAWALVLDEFALIVNLHDVYWAPAGDLSILALFLFGVSLLIAALIPPRHEPRATLAESESPEPQ